MRNRQFLKQFPKVEPPCFHDFEYDYYDDEDQDEEQIEDQYTEWQEPVHNSRYDSFKGYDPLNSNYSDYDLGTDSIALAMSRIFAPQFHRPRDSLPCQHYSPTKVVFTIISIMFTIVILIEILLTRHYHLVAHLAKPRIPKEDVIKINTKTDPPLVDSHTDHDHWSHTGDVVGLYTENIVSKQSVSNAISIAIGCAITTRHITDLNARNMGQTLPVLRSLLSGFCKTASGGYEYHFYLAFDIRDQFFAKDDFQKRFTEKFEEIVDKSCSLDVTVFLHLVQCDHVGHPAWAQNDAMMAAYLDNMEYYYRVNDDSFFNTPQWTEKFIAALREFNPPNVGVVGPDHTGGNEFILTHDFVHKTHLDVFGFYYPRTFGQWWADDWITYLYQPDYMKKLEDVRVKHTEERGTRYNHTAIDDINIVSARVKQDQLVLQRY